jgi:hypothetical protein
MYRTVDAKFWHDAKVKRLRPEAKLLLLYLITNPHTHLCGFYYLPAVMQKEETGLPKPTLDTLWGTLSSAGLAWFDHESATVLVKNMLRYQGRGKKNEASAANQLQTLIDSPLASRFVSLYPQFADTLSNTLSDRVSEFGTPEQEQNKDQEKEQEQNKKVPFFDLVKVPSELDTPEVKRSLCDWLEYKSKRGESYKDPSFIERKLAEFVNLGPASFVAAVNASIGSNYAGLFPARGNQNGSPATNRVGAGQRYLGE